MADRNENTPAYVPARIMFEGGGIKRGLSAPEVAIVLGKPIQYALMSIILGLLQKDLVRIMGWAPVVLQEKAELKSVADTHNPRERAKIRQEFALQKAVVISPFEDQMLELVARNGEVPMKDMSFDILIVPLVNFVAARMAGYSLEESRRYYDSVIGRAQKEIMAPLDGVNPRKWFERKVNLLLLENNVDYPSEVLSYDPEWLNKSDQEIPTYSVIAEKLISSLENAVSIEALSPSPRLLKNEIARQIMTDIQANHH